MLEVHSTGQFAQNCCKKTSQNNVCIIVLATAGALPNDGEASEVISHIGAGTNLKVGAPGIFFWSCPPLFWL